MGSKQSKGAEAELAAAAPSSATTPVEDVDPLAGTPFALDPKSAAAAKTAQQATALSDSSTSDGVARSQPSQQPATNASGEYTSNLEESLRIGRLPHYSKVTDPVESINPITGRSLYYSARPWRCDDRFQDFFCVMMKYRDWPMMKQTWGTFMRCAYSDYGAQPTTPYVALDRREIMFYVDRAEHDMIRDRFWQRYPWTAREPSRIMMDDGNKMRVWRHQRELEMEAKEGHVEDMIVANSVGGRTLPSNK